MKRFYIGNLLTEWSWCICCCRASAFRCSNRSICSRSQTSLERRVSKSLLIQLCSWDFTWTEAQCCMGKDIKVRQYKYKKKTGNKSLIHTHTREHLHLITDHSQTLLLVLQDKVKVVDLLHKIRWSQNFRWRLTHQLDSVKIKIKTLPF